MNKFLLYAMLLIIPINTLKGMENKGAEWSIAILKAAMEHLRNTAPRNSRHHRSLNSSRHFLRHYIKKFESISNRKQEKYLPYLKCYASCLLGENPNLAALAQKYMPQANISLPTPSQLKPSAQSALPTLLIATSVILTAAVVVKITRNHLSSTQESEKETAEEKVKTDLQGLTSLLSRYSREDNVFSFDTTLTTQQNIELVEQKINLLKNQTTYRDEKFYHLIQSFEAMKNHYNYSQKEHDKPGTFSSSERRWANLSIHI